MERGLIFDIRRYSVHDGPGIRTTVFFKGCPLRCQWCHNPEGIGTNLQKICRTRQLNGRKWTYEEIVGKEYSSVEVFNEISKDLIFYEESGGGVTFSGGEPLMQPDFLLELLVMCREAGIHTAVDTSGFAGENVFSEITRNTDMLLFDLKTADSEKHSAFTGSGNETILKNLKSLVSPLPELVIRIPLIPGFNDQVSDISAIRNILIQSKLSVKRLHLLPYHRFGRHKYEALGNKEPPVFSPEISDVRIHELFNIFEGSGFSVKIGG